MIEALERVLMDLELNQGGQCFRSFIKLDFNPKFRNTHCL